MNGSDGDSERLAGSAIPAGRAMMRAMQAEMRIRRGGVPDQLPDATAFDAFFQMTADSFLFRTPGGVAFHYRRGKGVVADVPDEGLSDEYELYLRGTVFGAVAWLNGYCPLHASAVVRGGRAIAFTADSGGGKSTLAAALSARPGFAHLCDDTLVLDVQPHAVMAMPDGKPLKLWDDAFAIAGARRGSAILTVPGKFYASAARQSNEPAILTDLVFLDEGDGVRLDPVNGAAKLPLLTEALYRVFVHALRGDGGDHARMMTHIARKVRFWRLSRSRNLTEFTKNIEEIERLVDINMADA